MMMDIMTWTPSLTLTPNNLMVGTKHYSVFFLQSKTEKLSKNRKNRVEFHVLLHFYVKIFGKMEKLRAFGQLRLQKKSLHRPFGFILVSF